MHESNPDPIGDPGEFNDAADDIADAGDITSDEPLDDPAA